MENHASYDRVDPFMPNLYNFTKRRAHIYTIYQEQFNYYIQSNLIMVAGHFLRSLYYLRFETSSYLTSGLLCFVYFIYT